MSLSISVPANDAAKVCKPLNHLEFLPTDLDLRHTGLVANVHDFSALMQSPTFSSQVRRWMLEVVSIFHQSSAKSRSVSQLIPSTVMPASSLTRALPDTSLNGEEIGVARVHLDGAVGVAVE